MFLVFSKKISQVFLTSTLASLIPNMNKLRLARSLNQISSKLRLWGIHAPRFYFSDKSFNTIESTIDKNSSDYKKNLEEMTKLVSNLKQKIDVIKQGSNKI